MCFNNIRLEERDVEEMMNKIDDDETEKEGQKELGNLYDKLKAASCVTEAISSGIRQAIDDTFNTIIADTDAVEHFACSASETWPQVFALYAEEVQSKMCKQVKEMDSRGDLKGLREDVAIALSTCHTKARVVLSFDGRRHELCTFPFMSASVFSTLVKHLSRIPGALLEVRAGFGSKLFLLKSPTRKSSHVMFCAFYSMLIRLHPAIIMVLAIYLLSRYLPTHRMVSWVSHCGHETGCFCPYRLPA